MPQTFSFLPLPPSSPPSFSPPPLPVSDISPARREKAAAEHGVQHGQRIGATSHEGIRGSFFFFSPPSPLPISPVLPPLLLLASTRWLASAPRCGPGQQRGKTARMMRRPCSSLSFFPLSSFFPGRLRPHASMLMGEMWETKAFSAKLGRARTTSQESQHDGLFPFFPPPPPSLICLALAPLSR